MSFAIPSYPLKKPALIGKLFYLWFSSVSSVSIHSFVHSSCLANHIEYNKRENENCNEASSSYKYLFVWQREIMKRNLCQQLNFPLHSVWLLQLIFMLPFYYLHFNGFVNFIGLCHRYFMFVLFSKDTD